MKHRIATVKATGERFLVVTLDFRSKEVVCYGQLIAFSAGRALGNVKSVTTQGGRRYPMAEVELTRETTLTVGLANELFRQAQEAGAAV